MGIIAKLRPYILHCESVVGECPSLLCLYCIAGWLFVHTHAHTYFWLLLNGYSSRRSLVHLLIYPLVTPLTGLAKFPRSNDLSPRVSDTLFI